MSLVAKLKNAVKLRQTLKTYPPSTYGGKEVIKASHKHTQKIADRMTNARGKGIRFIKKGGRIIPIRPK